MNGLLLPFRLRIPVQRGDNREGIALTRHPPPGISRFRIFTPDSPFSLIMTARWPFGFFAPLIVTRSSPPSLPSLWNTLHPVNLCASSTKEVVASQRDRSVYIQGVYRACIRARHLSRARKRKKKRRKVGGKCRSL